MAVKHRRQTESEPEVPETLEAVKAPDRFDRLLLVVQAMWTDPYSRPHCRKSGGLPRTGCDCQICVADGTLKELTAQPVTMTG